MLFRIIKRLFCGRSISKQECTELIRYVEKAEKTSYKEQIIQYDKIYHHTLKKLGYQGSFGEILKRNPREIQNIDTVWELHKLRNSLVHELRERDTRLLEQKANAYREVLEKFIKTVTD